MEVREHCSTAPPSRERPLHRTQNKLEEAAKLHERALGIRIKALGEDHPDVAVSLNNLGLVKKAQVQ